MKIAIDARGANWYNGTGIGTYTSEILKYIIKNHKENFYHIYWSGSNYDKLQKENTKIIMASKKQHRFFEQYYFPVNLRREKIDIYHIPQNGIGISENIECKKIVTIHDLIPYILPETVGKGYLSKFLKEMPKIISSVDGIITVSNCSKKDILKFFPVMDENKIFVTPLAADSKYRPLNKDKCMHEISINYNIKNPFILYIGGFSPRKNVSSLITAFSKIHKKLDKNYDLVIVGSNKDDSDMLKELSSNLNIDKNIKFTGFVAEKMMPIFYNACDIFIYPSLYEGFGLPPLEAMSCGTPVIASNISSIPEVVEEGGILINPLDMENFMYSIEALINDITIREDLSSKALKQAAKFSWEKTSERTIEVYNKILNT